VHAQASDIVTTGELLQECRPRLPAPRHPVNTGQLLQRGRQNVCIGLRTAKCDQIHDLEMVCVREAFEVAGQTFDEGRSHAKGREWIQVAGGKR